MRKLLLSSVIVLGCFQLASAQQRAHKKTNQAKLTAKKAQQPKSANQVALKLASPQHKTLATGPGKIQKATP